MPALLQKLPSDLARQFRPFWERWTSGEEDTKQTLALQCRPQMSSQIQMISIKVMKALMRYFALIFVELPSVSRNKTASVLSTNYETSLFCPAFITLDLLGASCTVRRWSDVSLRPSRPKKLFCPLSSPCLSVSRMRSM